MIVDYDKEKDMVYISKQINTLWIQVGLNRDEVNQIVRSPPYNPQSERDKALEEVRRIALNLLPLSYYYPLRDKIAELREGKGGE